MQVYREISLYSLKIRKMMFQVITGAIHWSKIYPGIFIWRMLIKIYESWYKICGRNHISEIRCKYVQTYMKEIKKWQSMWNLLCIKMINVERKKTSVNWVISDNELICRKNFFLFDIPHLVPMELPWQESVRIYFLEKKLCIYQTRWMRIPFNECFQPILF